MLSPNCILNAHAIPRNKNRDNQNIPPIAKEIRDTIAAGEYKQNKSYNLQCLVFIFMILQNLSEM